MVPPAHAVDGSHITAMHLHASPSRPLNGVPPETMTLPDRCGVRLRPLEPEDEKLYPAFLAHVSPEDRRLRFFTASELSARQISEFTHYDPASAAAVVATGMEDGAIYGVARLHRTSAGTGEFAVLVRSDLKGHGLGRILMNRILGSAPFIRVQTVFGLILRDNVGMLALARELGFSCEPDPADVEIVRAHLDIRERRMAGVRSPSPS